jgi:hypothetical protein
MRRRALAVAATQGISLVMAMLVALVIALILLLAAPVKAQETTAEETTMVSADAANGNVETKTDNVSAEVHNGKVSVKTSNGSSSNNGTSQQSSMTVQQNQTAEGSGSQASTGDVNIGAAQNSTSCQNARNVKTFSGTNSRTSDSFHIDGNHFRLRYTTSRKGGTPVSVKVDVLHANGNSTGDGFTAKNGNDASVNVPEGPGTFKLRITANNASYNITVEDCRGTNNNNNNNNRHHHNRHHHNRHHHNRHHHNRNNNNNNNNNNAANRQYTSERRTVEDTVIKRTIPNQGQLANTGGVPLVGLAFLALAMVGLGVSVVRFAIRRER